MKQVSYEICGRKNYLPKELVKNVLLMTDDVTFAGLLLSTEK